MKTNKHFPNIQTQNLQIALILMTQVISYLEVLFFCLPASKLFHSPVRLFRLLDNIFGLWVYYLQPSVITQNSHWKNQMFIIMLFSIICTKHHLILQISSAHSNAAFLSKYSLSFSKSNQICNQKMFVFCVGFCNADIDPLPWYSSVLVKESEN